MDMSQPTHEKHGQVVKNPSPQATKLEHGHHASPAEEPLTLGPRRTSRERRLPRNLQDYYLGNIDDSEHEDSDSDDGDLEISGIVKFDTSIDVDDEEISSAPGLSSALALDILSPTSLPSLDNLEAILPGHMLELLPVTAGVEWSTLQSKLSKE